MSEMKTEAVTQVPLDDKAAEMAAFKEEFRNPSRNDGANLRAAIFPEEYHAVERTISAGRFMTTIEKDNQNGCHIFLLHGGGFELEASMHCDVMRCLADRGFRVTAYDYPLAPEHQYREINEAVYGAYRELRSLYPKDEIVLFGDSCGTALGLNLLLRLRDEGDESRPRKAVWPSPAVDFSLSNPKIPEYAKVDTSLDVEILLLCSERYAPGEDWKKPEISPIYAENLNDLGEMYICYSSIELLRPDTELLCGKLNAASGTTAKSHMCEGLFHDYILQVDLPESVYALNEIEQFLKH